MEEATRMTPILFCLLVLLPLPRLFSPCSHPVASWRGKRKTW